PYSSLPLFSSNVSLFWAVVVLVMMGLGLFMFGIPMNTQSYAPTSAEQFSPLWLGILFFICGLLYILSERNLSKKISITASLALSIISITGVLSALVEFSRAIIGIYHIYRDQMYENQTEEEELYARQHYVRIIHKQMSIRDMELVFCCHSLKGGLLLVTLMFFTRAALRSRRTQAVVVMRNLSSAE
uniref:Si:ch1073-291c23.2 n=1 Tax=Cyprinus carpio TaxID=7962 RepID=A0A8C1R971_CYPCA